MVMALSLFYRSDSLVLVVAYENGLVVVAQLNSENAWEVLYGATPHSQPILSLDVSPDKDYFFTSSADAFIVKHPIPRGSDDQPGLTETPSSSNDMMTSQKPDGNPVHGGSLLSAALAAQPRQPPPRPRKAVEIQTEPLKKINTKHSGQQSLKIRSDSRIFATAGWDSKIRVYSVKTMKEVAVLKWHQVGCYAVAFSSLDKDTLTTSQEDTAAETIGTMVPKLVDTSVRDKRIKHAKTAHWLAAGSKDGKVSLWDVF